jgi:hypothetical protein
VEVVEERGRVAAGGAVCQPDGGIERLAGEVDGTVGLGDPDRELGVAGVEAGQPGD